MIVLGVVGLNLNAGVAQVSLGSRVEGFLTVGGKLRNSDGGQNTDDGHNDEQLDEGKTLLVLSELFKHGPLLSTGERLMPCRRRFS